MLFKEFYRPKLPRNKYGGVSKNHLNRYTSVATTFNLRNTAEEPAEPINYEPFKSPIVFNEDELEYADDSKLIEPEEPAEIVIETE